MLAFQSKGRWFDPPLLQSFGQDYKRRSHPNDLVVIGTLNSKHHHHSERGCVGVLQPFNTFQVIMLTYPHCSWASLLGSLKYQYLVHILLPVTDKVLPFLNQQKGENGHRNYFMTIESPRKNVARCEDWTHDHLHTKRTCIRTSYRTCSFIWELTIRKYMYMSDTLKCHTWQNFLL